jgi:aspartate kinase
MAQVAEPYIPRRAIRHLEKGRVVIFGAGAGMPYFSTDTVAVQRALEIHADIVLMSKNGVDGVYTADPRVVSSARRIGTLSYEETQELAEAGAKVLNAQAVEFAKDRGIVIHARSTFAAGPGTRISQRASRELRISGVAQDPDLLVVRAEDGAAVTQLLQEHGAWPRELWLDGPQARLAIVPLENVHGLPVLLESLQATPGVTVEEGLAQVSVVGSGIGSSREELSRALRAVQMSPRAVLVSPLRIAMLVPHDAAADCVRRLHAEFVEGY